jgi:ATP-dependent DNA helicase RecQ
VSVHGVVPCAVCRLDGPSFGAGQPIDILLGKKTPRVASYGHDRLPVFGIGSDLSEGEWRGVVRQLLASGMLAVKGDHGTLALTELSSEVLRGEKAGHAAAGPAEGAVRPGRAGRHTHGCVSLNKDWVRCRTTAPFE